MTTIIYSNHDSLLVSFIVVIIITIRFWIWCRMFAVFVYEFGSLWMFFGWIIVDTRRVHEETERHMLINFRGRGELEGRAIGFSTYIQSHVNWRMRWSLNLPKHPLYWSGRRVHGTPILAQSPNNTQTNKSIIIIINLYTLSSLYHFHGDTLSNMHTLCQWC